MKQIGDRPCRPISPSMGGSMVISLTLPGVISDSSMICSPRTATMWYFRYSFWAISTKSLSLLRGRTIVPYLVASTPLLSAPGGLVAPPASAMHSLAVPASIAVSQPCGTACRCLAMVV